MAREGNVRKEQGPKPRLQRVPVAWPRLFWAWALVLLFVSGAAILHVRSRLAVVQLGYDLSSAAGAHRKLLTERRKLQVEVATLSSPRRLRQLAREFELVEPGGQQILRVEDGAKNKLALGHVDGE